VLHYGSLIGAYSLLTLLPELRIGVFTSYNGAVQDDPFTINSLLHVHLIDLFIGVRPSVDNASNWCSPSVADPFLPRNGVETAGSLRYPVDAYVGVYRHAVLGELEVWDDGTTTLMARYGSLEVRLRPAESGLQFTGVPTDQAWLVLLHDVRVEFSTPDGDRRCQNVRVALLRFTTFERRDEGHRTAISRQTVSATLSARAATALMIILLLLLYSH